jgi:hypothetical protein
MISPGDTFWLEPRHPTEWAFFSMLSPEQQIAELKAYYAPDPTPIEREMTAADLGIVGEAA